MHIFCLLQQIISMYIYILCICKFKITLLLLFFFKLKIILLKKKKRKNYAFLCFSVAKLTNNMCCLVNIFIFLKIYTEGIIKTRKQIYIQTFHYIT
jgi:hypothetical protein